MSYFSSSPISSNKRVFASQSHQQGMYHEMSLAGLEKQLQSVKQKQKQFYKLNNQLKILEKKSKLITSEAKQYTQQELQYYENQQMAQLKAEIEGVTKDIKNITEQGKTIKKQVKESKQQLQQLSSVLQTVKNKNLGINHEVMIRKQYLMQKQHIIQTIKDEQLENHKKITSLREQIKSLETQSHLLTQQLQEIQHERQLSEKNKIRLKKFLEDLQYEIATQKNNQRETHYKVTQMKEIKDNLEEELFNLKQQQQKLSEQYQKTLSNYHSLSLTSKQYNLKIQNLEDELFIVENDIMSLQQQFIGQGLLLQKQEQQNDRINEEFDMTIKEAIEVWGSIKQLIKIQQKTGQNIKQNKQNNSNQQIKFKALKIWNEIQEIINNSQQTKHKL